MCIHVKFQPVVCKSEQFKCTEQIVDLPTVKIAHLSTERLS